MMTKTSSNCKATRPTIEHQNNLNVTTTLREEKGTEESTAKQKDRRKYLHHFPKEGYRMLKDLYFPTSFAKLECTQVTMCNLF